MKTKEKKKGLRRKLKCFSRNQVTTQKKVFIAIWDYIRSEFVGFIRAGWLLIVSSSIAQISMGGRLNLDGGILNVDGGMLTLDGGTRPAAFPYNLSTGYRSTYTAKGPRPSQFKKLFYEHSPYCG